MIKWIRTSRLSIKKSRSGPGEALHDCGGGYAVLCFSRFGVSGFDPAGMCSGEVPRGEKMLYSGTDPESYNTEFTLVYEDKRPGEYLHH